MNVRPSRARTVLALSGIVAAALATYGMALTNFGGKGIDPSQGADQILRLARDRMDGMLLGGQLLAIAVAPLLLWTALLSARIRTHAESWVAMAAALGGGLLAVALLIEASWSLASAVAVDLGASDVLRVATTYGWEYARVLVGPALVVVASTAVAGFGGAFPRAFAWASAGYAVLLAIALIPVFPGGMVALLFFGWIGVVSVVMAVWPGSGPR
jgi:hypothetical protein